MARLIYKGWAPKDHPMFSEGTTIFSPRKQMPSEKSAPSDPDAESSEDQTPPSTPSSEGPPASE